MPSAAYTFGGDINGVRTDPVTYLLYCLGNRFEALEDERALSSGTQVLDFRGRAGERIDILLARFDMARYEAEQVGAGIHNFHTLSTILIRACGVNATQMIQVLAPTGGRLPNNQAQYDAMCHSLRQMGHILERAPGNIMQGLQGPRAVSAYTTDVFHVDQAEVYTTEPPAGTGGGVFGNGSGVQGDLNPNAPAHGNENWAPGSRYPITNMQPATGFWQ